MRWRLKWFLLACVGLALLMAYVAKPWLDQRRQAMFLDEQLVAARQLAESGATVEMDDGRVVKALVYGDVKQADRHSTLKKTVDVEQLHVLSGADDQLVESLKGHRQLRELLLGGPGITNKSLETIGTFHHLQVLSLIGTAIDDDGLKHLSGLENLRRLDLSYTQIRGTGFGYLSNLSALESLNLTKTLVDDEHLDDVARFSSLTYLELGETAVRGPGLAHLGKNRRLHHMTLSKMTLTDLSGLDSLDQLYSLRLFHVNVPPREMRHMGGMARLQNLSLHGPMFTDQHLENLADADQILGLEMWDADVTEDGLAQLRAMDRLGTLTLFGGLIDDAAERLSAKLPKVTIVMGDRREGRVFGPKEK